MLAAVPGLRAETVTATDANGTGFRAVARDRVFVSVIALNIVLVVLRIIGGLALLSLTVTGFVVAARKHFPWRRPARLTAILAIVPIVSAILRWKTSLFGYDTSVSWDTFINGLAISTITVTGVQIGLLFLRPLDGNSSGATRN